MKKNIFLLAFAFGVSLSLNTVLASESLNNILSTQAEDAKERFQYRNPKETLEFFGIKPGMKIAEALPGGGWYTKILLPFLGKEGHLTGIDYAVEMWPEFGGFATEEFVEKRKTWPETWAEKAKPWAGEHGANISAGTFSKMPEAASQSMDAVLFIRAMHNLARFEGQGGYMTQALQATFGMLKPGGLVGIVQHQAREDRPNEWANGSNGYLKKSAVINAMQAAGFQLLAESNINENVLDQANEGDIVWRLPPSLGGSKDNEELAAKMRAIGESHRMTLLFKKPDAS